MKTKRIWIWSLIFGILAAFVVYVIVFSESPTPTSAEEKTKVEEKADNSTATAEKEAEASRTIENAMVPVSEGKRAISLKVGLEQGVSGYIEPNSKVDIVYYETTIDAATKKEHRTAVLALQNIKVLASGKASDSEDEALQYETVTVEVTPEEGVALSLAATEKGGFYFMLRNEKDSGTEKEDVQVTRGVEKGDDQYGEPDED